MGGLELPQRVACECCGQFKGSLVGSHLYIFPDGSTYNGEWANGEVEGQGTYTWASGTKYIGQFKGGVPHGEGELIFKDGTLYKGVLSQGQIGGGEGQVQFRSGMEGGQGSKFEGGFEEAAANGRGVFKYPNSPTEGAWARGKYTQQQGDANNGGGLLGNGKGKTGRRLHSKDKGMVGISAASFSLGHPDTPLNSSLGSIKQRRSLSKGMSEGREDMQRELGESMDATEELEVKPHGAHVPPTPSGEGGKGLPLLMLAQQGAGAESMEVDE